MKGIEKDVLVELSMMSERLHRSFRKPWYVRALRRVRQKLGEWLGFEAEVERMRQLMLERNLALPRSGSAWELLGEAVRAVELKVRCGVSVSGETMSSDKVPPGHVVVFLGRSR
jgi:hypothetical protein